jgi:hypothetical protein
MSQDQANAVSLDHIASELERTSVPTIELLVNVINHTCTHVPVLAKADKTARLWQLIEAGAQVDAMLALIELELPQWRLRRLSLDDDKWSCSLSRQSYSPVEFDGTAHGHHTDPVLRPTCESIISPICNGGHPVCCDNFY